MNSEIKLGALVAVMLSVLLGYVLLRPHGAPDGQAPKPKPEPAIKAQIVYVSSKRCGWCDKMDRDTFGNAKVKERLAREFTLVKTQGKDAIERYGVRAFPTYLVASPDGKEIRRGAGYRAPEEFLAWLDGRDVREDLPFFSRMEDEP